MRPFPMMSGRPPVPRPLLDIDARQATLDERLVFSRASTAGYMDSDGVYKTVAVDAPRIVAGQGLLIEAGSTNLILWARDFTKANWAKTNCTAAKDQAGIDGAANAASSLTATADGATAIYSLSSGATSWGYSVYLRRVSGTGTVSITKDGGTTWTECALTTSWQRFTLLPTGANPVVGIRLATSGDVVAVDAAQIEYFGGNRVVLPTSAIMTAGAALTRSADVLTVDVTGLDLSAFSLMVDAMIPVPPQGYPQLCVVSNGTDGNAFDVGTFAPSSSIWFAQLQVGGIVKASSADVNYPAEYGVISRNAVTFGPGRAVHAVNGFIRPAAVDTPTSVPTPTMIRFNVRGGGSYNGIMVLQRFRFWQVPLHDEHLRRISE
ncbi:MAG TPA: hypothetical protein DCW68_06850 [Rhodospirillaceae bacterium]|nr:MAG: hypothetical protein A2018_01360 [Alphaproteobacteria bacterium GWF2_58_20]HAU29806.1 hypothetical protein [Rhodospirillaceae bacterium]